MGRGAVGRIFHFRARGAVPTQGSRLDDRDKSFEMKTFLQRKEDVVRDWHHVDATGVVLGKLAVQVAIRLMGKHKPTWTPGVDGGDFVVVTHAADVAVTGDKDETKVYRRHTGYVGGLVEETLGEFREAKPEKIIQLAVRRMLPKTRQGRQMYRRLKVYPGAEHAHGAQKPVTFTVE